MSSGAQSDAPPTRSNVTGRYQCDGKRKVFTAVFGYHWHSGSDVFVCRGFLVWFLARAIPGCAAEDLTVTARRDQHLPESTPFVGTMKATSRRPGSSKGFWSAQLGRSAYPASSPRSRSWNWDILNS